MGLMTVGGLADYLGVSKKTIYRLLESEKIPARKVGHQWRFERTSIEAWLRNNSKKRIVNILVVDDDEDICALFKDTLEEAGYVVTTTSDSSKGLELVQEQDYELVFLDLKMPEMDGVELLRRVKKAKPNLPVTIVTGYPDSDLMMKALTYGPLGVMNKPFTVSDILNTVNNYLHVIE